MLFSAGIRVGDAWGGFASMIDAPLTWELLAIHGVDGVYWRHYGEANEETAWISEMRRAEGLG